MGIYVSIPYIMNSYHNNHTLTNIRTHTNTNTRSLCTLYTVYVQCTSHTYVHARVCVYTY